jgi:hypothetical protein
LRSAISTVIFTLALAVLLTPLLVPASLAQTVRFRTGIFLHHSTDDCIWGSKGRPVPSGVYLCCLDAGRDRVTLPIVLLR